MTKKHEIEKREQADKGLSHEILGAVRYAGYIRQQTTSDVMRAMIKIRDERRYLDYGFSSFDDFLKSRLSPMSQGSFYRRLPVFEKESPELFDMMEELRVPLQTRLLLEAGDVRTKGKKVFIGDKELDAGNNPTIVKQVIVSLVNGKISTEKDLLDARAKLARQETQIDKLKGIEAEYEQLSHALEQGSPYEQAYLAMMKAWVVYISEVKGMSDEEREERMKPDLLTWREQWRQMEHAFKHGDRVYHHEEPGDRSAPYFQSDAIDGDNF